MDCYYQLFSSYVPHSCSKSSLMHGQLVGQNCHDKPRTVWNNVVLSDFRKLNVNRCTYDALNKPVRRELTCVSLHLMPAG